ncbi:hypothetical protein TSUD_179280 [Trifolium subterraneum]|uniref:Reverse transcriptase zinc-binding domain-containing protein n=1 Tax=Trifolium subterraneum TaxID=3900 RepID=A0A2Z6LKS6_TRISU|nr:hypothetical protein TSUD_179280 [Trifolium subterraneum]
MVVVSSREGGLGSILGERWGMGPTLFFWTDPWMDGIPLCERYGRLYELADNKSVMVDEMCSLGWGAVGEAWVWRRPLRAWEKELLRECQTLLLNVSLQDHSPYRWQWQPALDSGYTVRGAYQVLTDQVADPLDVAAVTAHLCISGCGEAKSASHLFLSCNTFGSLWPLVSSWIGSSLVTVQTLLDHFVQFTSSASGSRARTCNSYGLSAYGLCGQSERFVVKRIREYDPFFPNFFITS